MRISESFSKMRLSEYCTAQDIDRAIAVTVDSFVSSQKVSCKRALARAFAKYVHSLFLVLFLCFAVVWGLLILVVCRYTLNRPARQRGQYRRPRGGEGGRNGVAVGA